MNSFNKTKKFHVPSGFTLGLLLLSSYPYGHGIWNQRQYDAGTRYASGFCEGFSPPGPSRTGRDMTKGKLCERTALQSSGSDDDADAKMLSPLPALGPAGMSSMPPDGEASKESLRPEGANTSASASKETDANETPTFVNPKFALQYTCNICETKNRVIVSRQAYREGMVIAVCKGCDNKHWIADNLDPTLKHSNIEDYMESVGLGDTVNRVTEEVYEIERVWGLKEGVLTDESGNAVLE